MKRIAILCTLMLTLAACSSDDGGDGDSTPATDTAAADAGADTSTGSDAAAAADTATAADTGGGAADAGRETDAGGTADAGGGGIDWASMGFLDKQKHMKTVVMPAMKKLFQDLDSKRYEKFNCATCHGKDPQAAKFKMPATPIPLDPAKMPDSKSSNEYEAKFAKFMYGKVLPEMQKLINQPPFDPGTKKGFGCFGCHKMKK